MKLTSASGTDSSSPVHENRQRAPLPLWLTLLALPGLTAVSCRKVETPATPPPVVMVIPVTTSDAPLSTTLIGQLDSPQTIDVRARVEGFVDSLHFADGTEVKQGDLLFELDRKPFLERLAAAQGALAEAKAALQKYEKDVARLEPLALRNAIPRQDLDNAKASVAVGEAGVQTAQAGVESAQIDLGYCEIKAPVSGLIGSSQVGVGALVGKGEPTLLATISSLDPIWFYCNVSEVEYLKAEQRSREVGRDVSTLPVTLIRPDGTEHPDIGKFVFIDRAVNVKTGTLRVRAEFSNKEKLLRPGMFARIRVDLGVRKDVIQIPERALLQMQEKTFVWTVDAQGVCSQRQVKLGEQVGPNHIILDGLKPGDKIILEGIHKAREGAPVTAMSPEQFAAMKEKLKP